MASGQFVTYFRVSTQRQGASGLGLEAQKSAVESFLNGGHWEVIGSFTEVETGKGSNALDKRPQLRSAIDQCKKTGARLLIAKLDRLARNVHFISGLKESGVKFVAADMPDATDLLVNIMAAVAQQEAEVISRRTKDALAAAKARGIVSNGPNKGQPLVLGRAGAANLAKAEAQVLKARQRASKAANDFAGGLARMIAGMRAAGLSQRTMVKALNWQEIRTARGSDWTLVQLQRVLTRLNADSRDAYESGTINRAVQPSVGASEPAGIRPDSVRPRRALRTTGL